MAMLIAPKINENIESFTPAVRDMCADGVLEIQLLSRDSAQWAGHCRQFLETGLLRQLVVHLPISECQIALVYLCERTRVSFERLCSDCAALSQAYGARVSVLFHCDEDYRYISLSGCVDWLKRLMEACPGVYLLVENIFPDINSCVGDSEFLSAPFLTLLDAVDNPRLGFCFDLCHYEVGDTVFRGTYRLPKRLFTDHTRYVHFNRALNGDGYMSHETHSCPHENFQCCTETIGFLDRLGIPLDETVLTLEISETDYVGRPNLAAEYDMVLAVRDRLRGARQDLRQYGRIVDNSSLLRE